MNKIYLRKLNPQKDISNQYLSWMKDEYIHQYTEQKYQKHTKESIKKFVTEKNKSHKDYLFGIFIKSSNKHIGNIKLGPINYNHMNSFISYFIGSKEHWKKGYSELAIKELIKIAKKKKLKKVKAHCYKQNIGSIKLLRKCGFLLEGKLNKELILNNKRIDELVFGKLI